MSKKIKRIICCLCSSLVLIVALCLPFAFKSNTKVTNYASADASSPLYSFTGSNLVVYYSTFTGRSPLLSGSTLNSYAGCVVFSSISKNSLTFRTTEGLNNGYATNYTFNLSSYSGSSVHWSSGSSVHWNMAHLPYTTDVHFPFMFNFGTDFDANIVGVTIYQTVCPSGAISDNDVGASTRQLGVVVIRYFGSDANGDLDTTNFIEFAFLNQNLYNADSRLSLRTYYFTRIDTNSAQYSAGYNAGQTAGYSEGQTAGYNTGYSAGDSVGYTRGYNAGVNATNTYSFTNLISAVLDAPINAFTSLFNFEILGVNLSSFLLALFTICVVLTVIKFIF